MLVFIGGPTLFESEPFQRGSIQSVVEEINRRKTFALDTETSGLDYQNDHVILISIGWKDLQYVIDARTTDCSALASVMSDELILKIMHNSKFDMQFLAKLLNCRFENIYDTMLAEKVLYAGMDYENSLQAIAYRRLKVTLDKDVRSSFSKHPDMPPTLRQINYSGEDVRYLHDIMELQQAEAKVMDTKYGFNLRTVIQLENDTAIVLAEMESEGLRLDVEAWRALSGTADINLAKEREILDSLVISDSRLIKFLDKTPQLDLFKDLSELRKVTVNWDSPKQVLEVFRTLVGPDLASVNEKELQTHTSHDLIYEYIQYKGLAKLASAYGDEFLRYVKQDGKIHTSFSQILSTGRMSSSDPNCQQIPQDNAYRNCFIPDSSDYKFVSCDYSSQELTVIAVKSKDPVWNMALKEGKDLHSICADLVFGRKWEDATMPGCIYSLNGEKCSCPGHKKLRSTVKSLNFGLAYGMSEFKLSSVARISVEEARALITKYFKTFPNIKGFLDYLGNFSVTNGYITTFPPYRRVRWFPKAAQKNISPSDRGNIDRRGRNTPIQGAGANLMKLAMVEARRHLKQHPELRVKLVMTVHDQLDTLCHVDDIEIWAPILKRLMERVALPMFPNGEMKADLNISDKWEK